MNDQQLTLLAGIYLHIPFCKQACHYCNFHFTTSLRYKDDLVKALATEMALQKNDLSGEKINTIYFGGGTPSLLTIDDCQFLLENLHRHFLIDEDAEITLEANPDDITAAKLKGWSEAGINRLSIGIQSFFEEELQWMNRAHTAAHAKDCISLSQAAGFENISIDLIYGSPLLTDSMWQENVATATAFGIPHLSCYALTVEAHTPLHKQISQHKKKDVEDDRQAGQFLLLLQWLRASGYEHYEVSNFAQPGCRSRHNSSYWKGDRYLGLGPSAHSFDGRERSWNIASNSLYIKGMLTGNINRESEVLTNANRLNEQVMISLRTIEGINLEAIEKAWGLPQRQRLAEGLQRFAANGLVQLHENHASLTHDGMLRADGIASALFV